jgi:hypothetical protein
MRYMRHALRVDLLSSTLSDIAAAKAANIVAALEQQYKAVQSKLGMCTAGHGRPDVSCCLQLRIAYTAVCTLHLPAGSFSKGYVELVMQAAMGEQQVQEARQAYLNAKLPQAAGQVPADHNADKVGLRVITITPPSLMHHMLHFD